MDQHTPTPDTDGALVPEPGGGGPEPRPPVFVHSSYRTASTWLWAKFRRLPGAVSYYEVFHESLATMRADELGRHHSASWGSRHPPAAPYFLEYLPLMRREGGVAGYEPAMSLERFIPADGLRGDLSAPEHRYLDGLIRQARRGGRVPVLTCTRSLGRIGAIKRATGAVTVLVHRNLFHQWASYTGQAMDGNDFFLRTIGWTLDACRHDPFLAAVGAVFSGAEPRPDDEALFTAFLALHLYLYAHAHDAADAVVDATALAADPALQRDTGAALSRLVPGPIDLSDAGARFEASLVTVANRAGFVDTVDQFAKMVTSTGLSPGAAAFALRLKDEALAEWDLHDGYARRATAWFRAEADALRRRAEAPAPVAPDPVAPDPVAPDPGARRAKRRRR